MALTFHDLPVIERIEETADAASFVFGVKDEWRDRYAYHAGQFLTVECPVGDKPLRRSYSLSSCPLTDEHLRITVKRVQDGRVSGYMHQQVQPSDTLRVATPNGRFFVTPHAENHQTYYLFAAGSGITPIFSILKTVLHAEPRSHIRLLYGNRNADATIFRQDIEALAATHADRLKVVLMHSGTSANGAANNFCPVWPGRINEDAVKNFFHEHPPVAQETGHYICGPGSMIDDLRASLQRLSVPAQAIYYESFGGNQAPKATAPSEPQTTQLTANIQGQQIDTVIPEGETLLSALKTCSDMPYGCEAGVCGTCRAQLKQGEVEMDAPAALEPSEIASGAILTCQARPITKHVDIVVDES